MASELLKNRALIQRLKEPEVPVVKFNLGETGFEELITLPEPKPQELLDIQEDVRIQRQQDTMDKARPFLMDESIDFIERENFASGSKFEPNIGIFEDIVLNFNQGSEYKNVKDVFEEYYKITKDPLAKKQIKKGITKGTKAEKLIQPVLSLLETPEEKVNRVFTEALSTDTATDVSVVDKAKVKKASRASVWRANIADKTDLDQQFVNRILNKNPDYIKNKKLFDYLGQTQLLLTDLKDLPLKDQLAYAEEALKGRPVYTGITRKGQNKLMRDPAHKVMEFALRNFIANEGKGAVKFFNKNGTPIKYKTGLKIPYRKSIISYKGKKHTVADLRKPGYMQKFFPNVYNNQIKINKILNQEIDNPFKKGKKINFGDFMTEVQVKAYGWAPRAGSIDILHGPDGVKGDPFDNLTFGTKRLNYQLEDINKLYRFGKIDDASRLKLLDAAEGKLKGLQGDELLNAIVKQQIGVANQIQKGKTFGTTREETKKLIRKTGITPTKKLTAFQQLASGKNVGFDPILASKAGFEEFVKPAAKIGLRGATGAADLLLSAGAGPIGLGVGALIETGQAMPELTKGNIKEAGRRTIIGSLLPEKLVGSMQTDLLKLAKTPEEKIGMQNYIDFQNDSDRFRKRFANYQYLEANPFEAEGIDIEAMEKGLLNEYLELQARKPKIINKEVGDIITTLTDRLDAQNVENLEGFLGSIVGRRGINNREQIKQDIEQQVITGNEPILGQAPVQMSPEELDDIYESGIMAMANGGRIGFADGPMDPKRRLFLKLMGGIMSLPFIPKFMKQADVAKPIVKIAGSSTKMPDWFPDLINKVMFGGTGKKVDADLTIYEPKELPGISIGRYDDGRVFVEGENEYGKKYMIEYEPPGFELIDEKTGKAVRTKGEFKAEEEVPVNVDPDGNADFDVEVLDDLDNIMGPDTRRMEEFATGKVTKTVKDMTGDTGMKTGEYNVGAAEARAEQAAEEAAERLADEAEEAAAALDEID
jgi:hypothetical protein